jgi:mannose-6-phosphate isomerase-like protein (cupin superfamily)
MTDLNKKLDHVSDMLATVSQLIASGLLKRNRNKIAAPDSKKLVVETIYDDEASMIVIEQGMKGMDFPLHLHDGCVQFLICVRGRFTINVPSDNIIRVLRPKDCFTVPENKLHSVHCLENGSKLIGVVIPAEPAYRKT